MHKRCIAWDRKLVRCFVGKRSRHVKLEFVARVAEDAIEEMHDQVPDQQERSQGGPRKDCEVEVELGKRCLIDNLLRTVQTARPNCGSFQALTSAYRDACSCPPPYTELVTSVKYLRPLHGQPDQH
jgi:hypothetical protein